MDKQDVLATLKRGGLVPILRTPTAADALGIAELLIAHGITTVEIPLSVPGAIDAIAEFSRRHGTSALVGAGTVLDPAAAEACLRAGARFIVCPGFDAPTVKFCNASDLVVLPGALTPTEILTAWRAGADMVKVFPVSAVGGASYIRAIKAPLPQIPLCPTGGVTAETAAEFIRAGASALGVASDLVDVAALHEGRGEVIARRARLYLATVAEARGAA